MTVEELIEKQNKIEKYLESDLRKLEYLYEINPVVRVCMILEDINEELKIVEFESMIEEHLSKNGKRIKIILYYWVVRY